MAQAETTTPPGAAAPDVQLERGTYEIIRNRLATHGADLRRRLDQLNQARREVFGSIETKLIATERITSENNCVPRDMVPVGDRFIFGYNVRIGLKSETNLSDVFAVHQFKNQTFTSDTLELLGDRQFEEDFKQLYKYYKLTAFAKFQVIGPHLYVVFQVGKTAADIKAFKWAIAGDRLQYIDNRSDHEVRYPPQHEFQWTRTHRDLHRSGLHPHISIEDRVFVETVGGDLTIKVEDNTETGEGIYAEPVDNPDQVLDDAEIFYASVGNIILLKIRPYQEKDYRYIVFNQKIQQARRLDAIRDACVLLPEGHGLIFSNGYYLQTGEHKTFESQLQGLLFEKRINSPNGEDYLYVFHNRDTGVYVLLSYNMIEQRVETPIVCQGYSFFEDGHLAFFRADEQPQKHHAVQVWQTPYVGQDYVPPSETDSYLYKVGNRDIVRGMAECHEILALIEKEDSYTNLYVDLVKKAGDVLDSYYWIDKEDTFRLSVVLLEIKQAATAAVNEFDKVVRVRRNTKEQFDGAAKRSREIMSAIHSRRFEAIDEFVVSLADLRRIRGEIISLRELKYVDQAAVAELEKQVIEHTDRLSQRCVEFLLRDDALLPYQQRVDTQRTEIDGLVKVTDAKKLEEAISATAAELEMLIDIVSNLKIDDATQRTRIIDSISAIYSKLNQARATLKKKSQELLSVEGVAEFNSQMKLLAQAVVNYLDVCDRPERCDEYLTKVMVQIEELEGRFAEFDEFIVQLSEKREEIYAAFDTRKLSLVEARNKRAAALMSAAERILKGIATRVANLKAINDIHSYFASDLMIDKVRDITRQLGELDDNVKVDDIQSRLKTIREDAVRQLKDRQELFVEGENVIRFGKHRFSVNVQALDLTTVLKDGRMCFHLTGTNFLEPIVNEAFLATRGVWDQEVVSENRQVYRGEYLAYKLFQSLVGPVRRPGPEAASDSTTIPSPTANDESNVVQGSARRAEPTLSPAELLALSDEDMTAFAQRFMGPRYTEGYVKGVHDHDAALILRGLVELQTSLGLLKFHSRARALATVCWTDLGKSDAKKRLTAKLTGVGTIAQVFPGANNPGVYVSQLQGMIGDFCQRTSLFPESLAGEAAEYLFHELTHGERFSISQTAAGICRAFQAHLQRRNFTDKFTASIDHLGAQPDSRFLLLRDWVAAFVDERNEAAERDYVDEAAAVLLDGSLESRLHLHGSTTKEISGLVGNHPVTEEKIYRLNFNDFLAKLRRFEAEVVPRFESYVALKRQLVDQQREQLRLDEFKPRVLTSFVRNKLIDDVYLPLVGDNLAKQMGVVGEQKRTDLMGLLLLISPPGYGKTTLMEYIANRLGITFMKINGPAIGHRVMSLDPAEAPNASAREEVERLNLSLEMGDNVMIYLDDIQHCNPEFLQKFISLCDAQRKIEGVYRGRTRTYDLRGRKVAVVMAGNPYTESGEKFQIPDMLANRADTYNLGDVIGDKADAFKQSYLENALTSNPTLSILSSRSQRDVYAIIKMAQSDSQAGIELEGAYSVEELNELVGVMRKLMRIRDVVLRVNEQYIESAAQADAYRTEPPFKLQGSYRDMNKLAERIVPIMNDQELESLIASHYENQAQTLTTGAEANLLKFKELLGKLTPAESQRWEDIKRTFKRNVLLGGVAGDDKFGQVIAQMTTVSEGLAEIKNVLNQGMTQLGERDTRQREEERAKEGEPTSDAASETIGAALQHLADFNANLSAIKNALTDGVTQLASKPLPPPAVAPFSSPVETYPMTLPEIKVVNKVPKAFLDVIEAQFRIMQDWMKPIMHLTEQSTADARDLKHAIEETYARYEQLLHKMETAARNADL